MDEAISTAFGFNEKLQDVFGGIILLKLLQASFLSMVLARDFGERGGMGGPRFMHSAFCSCMVQVAHAHLSQSHVR